MCRFAHSQCSNVDLVFARSIAASAMGPGRAERSCAGERSSVVVSRPAAVSVWRGSLNLSESVGAHKHRCKRHGDSPNHAFPQSQLEPAQHQCKVWPRRLRSAWRIATTHLASASACAPSAFSSLLFSFANAASMNEIRLATSVAFVVATIFPQFLQIPPRGDNFLLTKQRRLTEQPTPLGLQRETKD
jgi:hypothetical protein